jgi:transcriptional regulator with XRE-family HTH domain
MMDKSLLKNRITDLCTKKGINMTTAFEQSGVGKNFMSNLKNSNPSKKNLFLLAEYFGVSVEYLLGDESESELALKTMDRVVDWLINNDYSYMVNVEKGAVSIHKDGDQIDMDMPDFVDECVDIKKSAEDGFELAMRDWERRNFNIANSFNSVIHGGRNVIKDSPNATLMVNDSALTKQERELIDMYREFSLEQQLNLLTYLIKIKNSEV